MGCAILEGMSVGGIVRLANQFEHHHSNESIFYVCLFFFGNYLLCCNFSHLCKLKHLPRKLLYSNFLDWLPGAGQTVFASVCCPTPSYILDMVQT